MKVDYCVVLGCPRSGTTFLMEALNALPNSECLSGSHLPVSIPHIVNQSLSPDILNALAFGFKHSLDNYLDYAINSRFSVFHKYINGCTSIKELTQALKQQRRINRLVYKEPFLAFCPEFIYEQALPNCRILHIYRDGRDCAESLVKTYDILTDEKLMNISTAEVVIGHPYGNLYVPWWVEVGREEEFLACTPYTRAIWMWKEMVRRCHDFFSRPDVVDSGRIMLLKYEDLVTDPIKYGESVVKHFGAEMNSRLQKRFKMARISSIGTYKRRNSQEIKEAEKIAKTELEIYGYL